MQCAGEGSHPEGHEGGLVADGGRLVADHVADRQAHALASWRHQPRLAHHLVHPCASALLCMHAPADLKIELIL